MHHSIRKSLYCLAGFIVTGTSTAQLTSSTHPIIKINTMGNVIVDEPKVQTQIEVIDNPSGINDISDPATWSGYCGMEFRGNSTQNADKKTYSVETWTAAGADTSMHLLGLPKEEDWIFHASHFDKTWARNILFFNAWQRMGRYASNTRFFELVIDGDYRGLYILMEKIKRDNDRVDIARLDSDDNAGDSLTGGYILRMDWPEDPSDLFQSDHNSIAGSPLEFQYYYPKTTAISSQQADYIKNYIGDFEDALFDPSYAYGGNRYNDLIELNSFVDLFIINEISRSADGYKLSSFLHKDKGDKLQAGPIWDFDLSTYNADYCGADLTTGWTYTQTDGCDDLSLMPAWWNRLWADTVFTNRLSCRYANYRQTFLHTDSVHVLIENIENQTTNARNRDEARWFILGENLFAQPSPIPTTFAEEYSLLKTYLSDRLSWIDANIPGNCANDVSTIPETNIELTMHPNPAETFFSITSNVPVESIKLYSVTGELVYTNIPTDRYHSKVEVSGLVSGMYMVRINHGITKRLIVQ